MSVLPWTCHPRREEPERSYTEIQRCTTRLMEARVDLAFFLFSGEFIALFALRGWTVFKADAASLQFCRVSAHCRCLFACRGVSDSRHSFFASACFAAGFLFES